MPAARECRRWGPLTPGGQSAPATPRLPPSPPPNLPPFLPLSPHSFALTLLVLFSFSLVLFLLLFFLSLFLQRFLRVVSAHPSFSASLFAFPHQSPAVSIPSSLALAYHPFSFSHPFPPTTSTYPSCPSLLSATLAAITRACAAPAPAARSSPRHCYTTLPRLPSARPSAPPTKA